MEPDAGLQPYPHPPCPPSGFDLLFGCVVGAAKAVASKLLSRERYSR